MNKKLILCLTLLNLNLFCSENVKDQLVDCLSGFFVVPTTQIDAPTKLYPTKSINEEKIEQFYGQNGLNLPSKIVEYIKSFYFYLEYCTRLEITAKIITATVVSGFLELDDKQDIWDKITNILTDKNLGIKYLIQKLGNTYKTINPSQEAWNHLLLKSTTHFSPLLAQILIADNIKLENHWEKITESSIWKNIKLTDEDLKSSYFWKIFLKNGLVKNLESDQHLLERKRGSAMEIFLYLPHMETSYYSADFTQKRCGLEFSQLFLLLNEITRNHYLKELGKTDLLQEELKKFKETKIYKAINTFYEPMQISQDEKEKQKDIENYKKTIEAEIKQLEIQDQYAFTCTTMANATHILTSSYVYDFESLEKKQKILSTKNPLSPNLLQYQAEDFIYLEDLKDLTNEYTALEKQAMQEIQQQKIKCVTVGEDNELVTMQSAFGDFFKSIGKAFINVGKAFWGGIKTFGKMIADGAKTLYYSSGMAQVFQHMSKEEAAALAKKYKGQIKTDAEDFANNLGDLGENLAYLYYQGFTFPLGLSVAAFSDIMQDPSIFGSYDSVVRSVAKIFKEGGKLLGESIGELVTLNSDALAILANGVLQAFSKDSDLGGWGEQWATLGRDIVTSFTEMVNFTLTALKATLQDIIQAIGYLIHALTSAVIDGISSTFALINKIIDPAESISEYYKDAKEVLSKHKRLISMALVTVAAIGIGVFGGPIGTVGAVMMVISIPVDVAFLVGSEQSDIAAEERKKRTDLFFENFKKWAAGQEVITRYTNETMYQESNSKLNAELINRQLGLGTTEIYLNQTLAGFACQTAKMLGFHQNQILDENNEDVGNNYGYKTGWLNLNPTRGLMFYEPSRKAFAQEIPVAPIIIKNDEKDNARPQFWYLQNITKDFEKSASNTFEIRFKPLILQDEFYIGVGIGGVPTDIGWIKNNKMGYVNKYEYTKILVGYKTKNSNQVLFGAYQPNPDPEKSWLIKSGIAPEINTLEIGKWYHMRAKLVDTNFSVQIWKEGETSQTKTLNIQVKALPENYYFNKCSCQILPSTSKDNNKKSISPCFGHQITGNKIPLTIICSGASAEFEIIEPKETFDGKEYQDEIDKTLKNLQSYEDISKENIKIYEKIYNPNPFKNLTLTPLSQLDLIKGIYAYKINKQPLQNPAFNNTNDIVIFAERQQENQNQTYTLGIYPIDTFDTSTKKYKDNIILISLLTGKIINQNNQTPKYLTNILYQYTNSANQNWGKNIQSEELEKSLDDFAEKITSKNYQLPGINFKGANQNDIKDGRFIYQTNSTLKEFGITDYIIFLNLKDDKASNLGIIYTSENNEINGILSLVTNTVYTFNKTSKEIPQRTETKISTEKYTNTNGIFTQELQENIKKSKGKLTKIEKFKEQFPEDQQEKSIEDPTKTENKIEKPQKPIEIPKVIPSNKSINEATAEADEEIFL